MTSFIQAILQRNAAQHSSPPPLVAAPASRSFWTASFDEALGLPLDQADGEQIVRARPAAQRNLARSLTTPVPVATHLWLGREREVATVALDVTLAAIYIVRNPLDLAVAIARRAGRSIDEATAIMRQADFAIGGSGDLLPETVSAWSRHVASWMSLVTRPVLMIRCEDLLSNPAAALGQVARFLRVDPAISDAPAEQAMKAPGATLLGQLRHNLSESQAREILNDHAPMMQRIGYLPADCGAPVPTFPATAPERKASR